MICDSKVVKLSKVLKMNAYKLRHLENALLKFEKVASFQQPLDLFLRRYFQAHRELGDTERKWVVDNMYEIVRWRGLLDAITYPPVNWPTRLRTMFQSDRWKSHSTDKRLPAHVRCSFPRDLFARIENALGTSKAIAVCNALNEPPMVFLRVNTSKVSRDRVYKFLVSKEVPVEKSVNSRIGLVCSDKMKLLELPELKQGWFEFQDESSQLIGSRITVLFQT